MNRVLILLLTLSLLGQLGFSFYYSSAILTQNTNLSNNKELNKQLKERREMLEEQLADFNSLKNIKNLVDPSYQTVTNKILLK